MTRPFEVLGLDWDLMTLDQSVKAELEDLIGPGNYPVTGNQVALRQFDLGTCLRLCIYESLIGEVQRVDAAHIVRTGVQIAVDFMYGDYLVANPKAAYTMRKAPDNPHLKWLEVYRDGLLLTMIASDLEAERRLVEWIEPWLPFDESSYLLTREDNSYHKLLAEFLKYGHLVTLDLQAEIQSKRHRRPKLLLSCLEALRSHESAAFAKNLREFLSYYLKSEFYKSGVPTCISVEGSILWHVAQRAGIKPSGLNEKQAALIMTRQTLGLE